MSRPLLPRAAALALGLLLLRVASPPAAAGADTTTEIPAGVPVGLDGRVLPAEWEDAAVLRLSAAGPEVRVKQVRGMLLLGLSLGRPWTPGWRLVFYARAGAQDGSFQDPGAVFFDLEPYEHNRPHALVRVRGKDGWARTDGRVVARAADLGGDATAEIAVPLSLLGVLGREPPPLRWVVAWTTPGRAVSHVTWPVGLDLGASVGTLPPDLATTARWARSTRFPDASGPGAFPKTEWEAMVAFDREVTARGEAAHALTLALLGDGAAGPEAERPKKDAPVLETVLGNLRWIGTREPLTHADLRARAVALWNLNRAPEAVAVLESLVDGPRGPQTPEDLRLAATVAVDAERFQDAAQWYDAAAQATEDPSAASFKAAAERARSWGKAYEAERKARAEDAARDDQPLAVLRTSKGDVVVRLLEDDCPQSVAQFVHLAEAAKGEDGKPFYAGTAFHRVVAAGVAQGGDPRSRTEGCENAGGGGSTWWIPAEKNPRHGFFRGAVGFAMAADRKVRSQFFVMTAPKPALADAGFACFGTVIGGMDVVDRLEVCDTLLSVTVLRKRDHPYEPKKTY